MKDWSNTYPLLLITLLTVGTSSCLPAPGSEHGVSSAYNVSVPTYGVSVPTYGVSAPTYGVSGFDALGGLGQRMTDTMLEQATSRNVHSSLQLNSKSPIQMTKFVNLHGSTVGDRFGHIIAEHMAQRFTEKGYLVSRSMSQENLLKKTFSKDAKPDEQQ